MSTCLPVLDPECLRLLGEELGDPAGAAAFLAGYRELLPARMDSISCAVAAQDFEAAMDRVLSLKVTSTMVGARQLAGLSAELELLVRVESWAAARAAVHGLARAVAALTPVLSA